MRGGIEVGSRRRESKVEKEKENETKTGAGEGIARTGQEGAMDFLKENWGLYESS